MDNRPNSIKHLFEMLKNKPSLKDKISLKDEKLSIVFGEHYILDVKWGFYTYINDKYDFDFEDQDIVDFIIDIAETNYYIVESKNVTVPERGNILFPNCKRFMFLSENAFEKQKDKLLIKQNIKIFNHDKIVYDS